MSYFGIEKRPGFAPYTSWSGSARSARSTGTAADSSAGAGIELALFGQRLRHARRAKGLTLADLGARVGRAPSVLSELENGRTEPRLSLVEALAQALGIPVVELLKQDPPSRRAQLEIALEQAQQDPAFRDLALPHLKVGTRVPSDILERIVTLYAELRRERVRPTATPEEARLANTSLRNALQEHGNYITEIEHEAAQTLQRSGYSGGAISQGMLLSILARHGFAVRFTPDLPLAARSVTDLRNNLIYLAPTQVAAQNPRTVLLQTLGHFLLGHDSPRDFADFLRQWIEAGYFAAAVLMPEQQAVQFVQEAKQRRDLAVEDLVDVFSVSYEMAAHRFTSLATKHLELPCHFAKNGADGIIRKAYENDGIVFPVDATGTIEGQRMCRYWPGRQISTADDRYSTYYQYLDTTSGTYWCAAYPDIASEATVTVGVPFEHSRWFRGRETRNRTKSGCPDPFCCRRPSAELSDKWDGFAWPSARAHAHLLYAMPSGIFPGVDDAEVYAFLERHQPDEE